MTSEPGKAESTSDSESTPRGYAGYPQVILRQAEGPADCVFLFDLRQTSGARMPTWDEHEAWFNADVTERVNLIVTDMMLDDVGTVRRGANGEVSITIAPDQRGKGLAVSALRALRAAFDGPLTAKVNPTNVASLRAFQRAGWWVTGSDLERWELTSRE